MQCRAFQKHFSDYLDGTLERRLREALDQHLRSCAACRADLHSLQQTIAWLHQLPMEAPPPAARQSLARTLHSLPQPVSWWESVRLRWRVDGLGAQVRTWAFGTVASVLLFLAGALSMQYWNAPVTPFGMPGVPSFGSAEPRSDAPFQPTYPNRQGPLGPGRVWHVGETPSSVPVHIRTFVESPLVASQAGLLYIYLDAEGMLPDVEVSLYPAAGLQVTSGALLQQDASYLLGRGPLGRGKWIPVELMARAEGEYHLRISVRCGAQRLASHVVPVKVRALAR